MPDDLDQRISEKLRFVLSGDKYGNPEKDPIITKTIETTNTNTTSSKISTSMIIVISLIIACCLIMGYLVMT